MKVHEHDGSVERRTVTAMIVDATVLGKVAGVWTGKDFAAPQANTVGTLCVEYYHTYGKAPGREIEALVRGWAEGQGESDAVALVSDFVGGLSGEYEQLAEEINPQYAADQAMRLFNRVRATRLKDDLEADLAAGRVGKAMSRIETFARVEVAADFGTFLFQDQAAIDATLDGADKPIVEYPGGLGEFFGDALHRDAFVSFMGPEGSGKSWWLMDVAFRACCQRRRVAYFVIGDMSEPQVKKRLLVRLHQAPLRAGDVRWPVSIDPPSIRHETQRHETGLTRKLLRGTEERMRRLTKSKRPYFHMAVRPAATMKVGDIRTYLRKLEVHHDFIADVVVIDYADVLANPPGIKEPRDAINENWKQLRGLSQERHCLIVTATQTNRESYDAPVIKMKHVSEDKRKLSFISAGFGINVGDDERAVGMTRLNSFKVREQQFDRRRFCYCAGCLELGNPAVLSAFPRRRPAAPEPSTNGRRRAAT